MKIVIHIACAAAVLALGTAARAEDFQLLKAKVELVAGQAKDLYDDSCRKGSASYGAQYQYYFGLMYAAGTNVMGRAESPTTTNQMRKYLDLTGKDYEAYTRISAETDKAAATGYTRGKAGGRARAKRLTNAEKLRDKELESAIKRWEAFVTQLKKDAK